MIRRATSADGVTIADIFLAARGDSLPAAIQPGEADTRAYLATVVTNPANEVWVAEREGVAVGFMSLREEWVDHLYVRPGWYRRHIGSTLINRAKHDRPHGLRVFCAHCRQGTRSFYAALGFVAVRSNVHDDGTPREPDVEYAWSGAGAAQPDAVNKR